MRIFRHLDELPVDLGATVVSVGNFDGVHCAHQRVLSEVIRTARNASALAIAVTFDPHPTRVLRPANAPKLITPLPVKLELLKATGVDATLIIPFTQDFATTTPRDFAKRVLVERLHAIEVHEGANFHFGHKAAGNVTRLTEFGREFGFRVVVYPEMMKRDEPVSSSRIRQLLAAGEVSRARTLLGRNFSLIGTPAKGRGYGSKYTVPTINLASYEDLVPANGVYVTRSQIGEQVFDSVTNIGVRPTFGDSTFAIETHLMDFRPLAVSEKTRIEIEFLKRLRDEQKFPSVDALRQQIGNDVRQAQRYFRLERRVRQTSAPAIVRE
jgi:riboflavin kinase / FMN adenylyltransferase